MSKGNIITLIVAAVVFLALGFVIGQVVQATVNTPGSEDDPLVSQSYVEKLVGERTAALQTSIEELQSELDALKGGAGSATPTNTNTNTNTGTNTDTTVSGKTVVITGNTVNVRAAASTSAERIASATKGTKLTYISTSGDWYEVELADGTHGWVSSAYSQLK